MEEENQGEGGQGQEIRFRLARPAQGHAEQPSARRNSGEEIRFTHHLPMKMFIFDAERVMPALPGVSGESAADFTMLVVEDPGFTDGFERPRLALSIYRVIMRSSLPGTAGSGRPIPGRCSEPCCLERE
jgi:hypothetical protein